MLLQKSTDKIGVGISSMRKSIYLLKTTPSSHTYRFHPLPLATPTSCSPHPLATPIHSTHSPQLSSILKMEASHEQYTTHSEIIKAAACEQYSKHPEKKNASSRRHYITNREKKRTYSRKQYSDDPSKKKAAAHA